DLRDLLFERILFLVNKPHHLCRTRRRIEDEAREGLPARSAVLMARVGGRPHTEVLAMVHDGIDLAVHVRSEAVHRDDRRESERLQDPYVRIEVHHAGCEGFRILGGQLLPLRAAMVLQRPDADDEHRGIGSESALAAHQVHELLGTEVRPEADLRDDDIPEAEPEAVREDGVVAVRDVRERPAVDEGRRTFERLHEVRHECVLQEDRRGAVNVQVSDLHRPLLAIERDDDALEALLEVRDPFREAEDRHHLARGGDYELILPRDPVLRSAKARDDDAQLAVVHVQAPREEDPRGIDVQLVPVEDVRVQDCGDQIVRGANRVDVPCEMEVDLLHREDLGSTATGGASLRAEYGSKGGLADRHNALLPQSIQGLAKSDRREGLPLSIPCGRRACDEDELPWRAFRARSTAASRTFAMDSLFRTRSSLPSPMSAATSRIGRILAL